MKRRYCGPCDRMTNANPCEECGADTDRWPAGAEPLEPEPVFRGREASAFQAETQDRLQRDLKR